MTDWASVLTAEWLRDLVTSLVLLALGGALGGAVLWKLQDRWIRRRIREEKLWDMQRDTHARLVRLQAEFAQIATDSPILFPGQVREARRLAVDALEVSADAQVAFADSAAMVTCIAGLVVILERVAQEERVVSMSTVRQFQVGLANAITHARREMNFGA